jgi:predicted phosphodiesterase
MSPFLRKTIAGRRRIGGGIFSELAPRLRSGIPKNFAGYESSVLSLPSKLLFKTQEWNTSRDDEHFDNAVDLVDPIVIDQYENSTLHIAYEGNSFPLKVGIISDTHQNTLFVEKILDEFSEFKVSILFLLGDYCYTRQPDAHCIRSIQVKKTFELVERWLAQDKFRSAVVLAGNHEMQDWYFENIESKNAVRKVFCEWSEHDRMHFSKQPLRSFEMENSVDVILYPGYNRAGISFRLSHAITSEYVEAAYKGLSLSESLDRVERVESTLGKVWLEYQLKESPNVAARWQRFLSAKRHSDEFLMLSRAININIARNLDCQNVLDDICISAIPSSKDAQSYRDLIERVELGEPSAIDEFRVFWGPLTRIDVLKSTSPDFAYQMRHLYSSLGIGMDYSLCGHFHADLGMKQSSIEFDTYIIGVGGAQPQKLIGTNFSAYVLEIGDSPDKETDIVDTLYRYSMLDDIKVPEFDWDLTKKNWHKLVNWT